MQAPLLGLGHAGGRQAGERGAAAGERREHEVVGAEPVDELDQTRERRWRSARWAAGGRRRATSIRSSAIVSSPWRTTTAPASSRGRRGSARARRRSRAWPCRSRPRPRGRPGFSGYSRPAIATPDVRTRDARSVARPTSHASRPALGHPQRQSAQLGHAGRGELDRVRDHAAIAAGNDVAGVGGRVAELLLDPDQAVVLGGALAADRRPGLDLAGAEGDGEVGDDRVLGLARALGDDDRVAARGAPGRRRRGPPRGCRSG